MQIYFSQRKVQWCGIKFLAAKLLIQSDANKFVLLGSPGSGKTTLLSYFAVMLAQNQAEKLGLEQDVDYLPILIKMRDLSRLDDIGDISILDYARQFAEKTMSVKNLPRDFFEHWLEDGRALILLDGLDEIAEESKRYKIVQRIENFLGRFQRNIAIITSRPAGYKRDFFRTEEFPHYKLLGFDDGKVEEFVNHWYDSRFQDKDEADRHKERRGTLDTLMAQRFGWKSDRSPNSNRRNTLTCLRMPDDIGKVCSNGNKNPEWPNGVSQQALPQSVAKPSLSSLRPHLSICKEDSMEVPDLHPK